MRTIPVIGLGLILMALATGCEKKSPKPATESAKEPAVASPGSEPADDNDEATNDGDKEGANEGEEADDVEETDDEGADGDEDF